MISCAGALGAVRWAVVNQPRHGEKVSGDLHVVAPTDDGVLIAVMDGLGHGPDAAAAARAAACTLEVDASRSVEASLLACHRALAHTRGAVMSIVRVRRNTLTWVGVGNVEGVLVPGPHSRSVRARLSPSGGVVGHSLPPVRCSEVPIARGDLLVLGTDGLASDFPEWIEMASSPARVVDALVARCATGRDDTLALAARYDGGIA